MRWVELKVPTGTGSIQTRTHSVVTTEARPGISCMQEQLNSRNPGEPISSKVAVAAIAVGESVRQGEDKWTLYISIRKEEISRRENATVISRGPNTAQL